MGVLCAESLFLVSYYWQISLGKFLLCIHFTSFNCLVVRFFSFKLT